MIVIRLQSQETRKTCCPPFSVNLETAGGTVAVELAKSYCFHHYDLSNILLIIYQSLNSQK